MKKKNCSTSSRGVPRQSYNFSDLKKWSFFGKKMYNSETFDTKNLKKFGITFQSKDMNMKHKITKQIKNAFLRLGELFTWTASKKAILFFNAVYISSGDDNYSRVYSYPRSHVL